MNLTTRLSKQAGGFWNWNVFGGGFTNLPIPSS
jgi:NADH-quinone oxidoreductase subunit H